MPNLWIQRHDDTTGASRFFRVALCHESLANMYQINFTMMQQYKYTLSDLENMVPWEREIYTIMLIKWMEEEAARIEAQNKQ